MDALTFLKSYVGLFKESSVEDLTGLAVNSTLGKFAPGQVVLRAGMTVEALHVVATGKVEVHAKLPGKSLAIVAEVGQGEVFGEVSILEQTVAGATVKAGPEGALILLIPEAPFRALLARDAAFAERVRALVQSRRAAPSSAPS